MEEKRVLVEELQLLRARIDRNPELTRFAAENIRLLDHIKRLILYPHFIF
jgi:kinesin family protein 15